MGNLGDCLEVIRKSPNTRVTFHTFDNGQSSADEQTGMSSHKCRKSYRSRTWEWSSLLLWSGWSVRTSSNNAFGATRFWRMRANKNSALRYPPGKITYPTEQEKEHHHLKTAGWYGISYFPGDVFWVISWKSGHIACHYHTISYRSAADFFKLSTIAFSAIFLGSQARGVVDGRHLGGFRRYSLPVDMANNNPLC